MRHFQDTVAFCQRTLRVLRWASFPPAGFWNGNWTRCLLPSSTKAGLRDRRIFVVDANLIILVLKLFVVVNRLDRCIIPYYIIFVLDINFLCNHYGKIKILRIYAIITKCSFKVLVAVNFELLINFCIWLIFLTFLFLIHKICEIWNSRWRYLIMFISKHCIVYLVQFLLILEVIRYMTCLNTWTRNSHFFSKKTVQ